MFDEVRHAVRGLGRAKLATFVIMGSLALGTGANAALYSVLDALLFRPPPGVEHPARLVSIFTSQFNGGSYGLSSYPDVRSLESAARSLESLAAFDDSTVAAVRVDAAIQRVRIARVTSRYFATLGLRPQAGTFDPAPGINDREQAVISFSLWTTLARPDVIGRPITIADREYRVAGIAPPGFAGLQLGRPCDVWVPLTESEAGARGQRRLGVIGRLRPGANVQAAAAEAETLAASLAVQFPESNRGTRSDPDAPRRMHVARYSRIEPTDRRQIALIGLVVLGATVLLLLSACVNAGNLLLARSAARRRELAVKLALGASRGRLARQVLIEALIVSVGGGLLGLVAAHWTTSILPAFFAPEEAAMLDTSVRGGVAAIAIGLSVVAAVLFAIGPARHALRAVDAQVLRADSGAVSDASARGDLRAVVVTGQVALSTVLLIAAGLLTQALDAALEGDPGPGGRGVAVALVRMPGALQGDAARGIAYASAVTDDLRTMDGIREVGWISTLPVGRSASQTFELDAGPSITERLDVDVNVASARYFHAMRIPVIEGRLFNAGDGALAPPVVLVNDVLARWHFGGSAVGRRLRTDEGSSVEIIGVVRTTRYRTFQEPPQPMVYFPLSQRHQGHMHLVARTASDADPVLAPIRERLLASDDGVTIIRTMTFDRYLTEALSIDRLTTTAVTGCGLAAIVLATIGLYGVIADAVRRRTPEIALRVALGARRLQILRLVVGEGLHLTMAGACTGIVAAVLGGRVAGAFVHAVPPIDTLSLALVPVPLAFVVVLAALLPMRRALEISPGLALRAD
jgi:predicted permease